MPDHDGRSQDDQTAPMTPRREVHPVASGVRLETPFPSSPSLGQPVTVGLIPVGVIDPTPRVLGKYLVRSRIDVGGMGAVYEARHMELGQVFALKTIRVREGARSEEVLADARDRFDHEKRLHAKLGHDRIGRGHGLVRASDGPGGWADAEHAVPGDAACAQGPDAG